MARKTRIKSAAAAVDVPQNREAAAAAVAAIGIASRELTRIEADMNDAIALLRQQFEQEAEPYRRRIGQLTDGLQIFAEANRAALTQGGKTKTVAFTSGELVWRMRPPSVRVTGVESVLDALRRLGLKRFIREKEEVNKEAILNEPEAVAHVPGIAISQGEDFVVVPFEAELAEVA